MCDSIKISQDQQLKMAHFCLDMQVVKITLIAVGVITAACGLLGMIAVHHPGTLNAFVHLGGLGASATIACGIICIAVGTLLLKVKPQELPEPAPAEPQPYKFDIAEFAFAEWNTDSVPLGFTSITTLRHGGGPIHLQTAIQPYPWLPNFLISLDNRVYPLQLEMMAKPIDEVLNCTFEQLESYDPAVLEVICYRLHCQKATPKKAYAENTLGWALQQTVHSNAARLLLITHLPVTFLDADQIIVELAGVRHSVSPHYLWKSFAKGLSSDSSWINQWHRYIINLFNPEAIARVLPSLPEHVFHLIDPEILKDMSEAIAELSSLRLRAFFPDKQLISAKILACLDQESQSAIIAKLPREHSLHSPLEGVAALFATPARPKPPQTPVRASTVAQAPETPATLLKPRRQLPPQTV